MRSRVEMELLFAGLSVEQRVEVAVRAALVGCRDWRFVGWAAGWLDGSDRSAKAALRAGGRRESWPAGAGSGEAAALLAAGRADDASSMATLTAARAERESRAQPPERRVDLRVLIGDVRAGLVRPRLPVTTWFVGGPRAGCVLLLPEALPEMEFAVVPELGFSVEPSCLPLPPLETVVYRRAEPAGWVALTGRATYELVDGLPPRRGATGVRPEDFA